MAPLCTECQQRTNTIYAVLTVVVLVIFATIGILAVMTSH